MDTKLSENWNWRNFQEKRRKKKKLWSYGLTLKHFLELWMSSSYVRQPIFPKAEAL